ncbi:hypothetical protein [Nocardia sp. NPDC046763]|uniref:hypothetical protein n=1 Tax=Nocardia sp. NPDC046763 TaxID=3155256 RepID=UPI0033FC52F9
MPEWAQTATRRHRLLSLGVSVTEQEQLPAYELDALLAVDDVINRVQSDRIDRAKSEATP